MEPPLEAPATEALRRKLSFSGTADEQPTTASSAPERLRVIVRVRPLGGGESASDMTLSESAVSIRTVKSTAQGRDSVEENSFSFDTVFRPEASQAEVFEGAMLPQVRSLLDGRDTLTFAYGITNAGKTYTIQGKDAPDELGVLPRALDSLFGALRRHADRRAGTAVAEPHTGSASALELDDACTYEVRASFLEVYGNDAFDLLAPPELRPHTAPGGPAKRPALRLKEDRGQVFVEGLREVECVDVEVAMDAVALGWQQRQQASNGLNDESSRSHAVLCIKLLTHHPGADKPSATRLCVVDLAGAERQKRTQANGARLNEAMSINKDLMVLGHCLRDLRYNQLHAKGAQKVPPFRDSRITMLFRDYLSGSGQISVVAAVSPKAADAPGTLDTLRFAAIAQQVKIVADAKLPPSLARPGGAPLPRVANMGATGKAAGAGAGGGGGARAAVAPIAEGGEPALDASLRSISSNDWTSGLEAEAAALRQQVVALQQRLMAQANDRVMLERQIREEVAAEMREHLEVTESEMRERLDLERYQTEERFHQKLALVKGTTEKRADAASVAAHTEILQQTRDHQRREAEHAVQVRKLETEVEQRRVELESTKAALEALRQAAPDADALASAQQEAAEATAAAAAATAKAAEAAAAAEAAEGQVEAERKARSRAEAELAEKAEGARELAERCDGLEFRLQSEQAAKAALAAQVTELQGRLSNVVELSRASRRASRNQKDGGRQKGGRQGAATVSLGDDSAAPAPMAPHVMAPHVRAAEAAEEARHARRLSDVTSALVNGDGVTAGAPDDGLDGKQRSARRFSRRGGKGAEPADALSFEEAEAAAVCNSDGKPPKPSKLKQLRTMAFRGGGKKGEAASVPVDEAFYDFNHQPVAGGAPFHGPTPVARRTRSAKAAQ